MKSDCPGCSINDEVTVNSPDQIPNGPLSQRFKTSLIKNPDATAIYMPFDVNMAGARGAKDAQEAGSKALIVGGSGGAAVMDFIRRGSVGMVSAHDIRWMGWGAIDNLNRVLNGQPTVPQSIGVRAVDKDDNLPATPRTDYESPIDWRAGYLEQWGVAG